MKEFDLIVIGSGQGGVPLATHYAGQGQKVLLIERAAWGGSCINYGCTPSKSLLASAHAAQAARQAKDLGIHAQVEVDFPRVMSRIRKLTAEWSQGVAERLKNGGVEVVKGEAHFTAERTLAAAGQEYRGEIVVINTGMSPRIPPIKGLEGTPYLTYKNIWQLERLPERTVALGAGFVSLELGQALARLGSQVEIIERAGRLARRESQAVSQALQTILEADGIKLHFEAEAQQVDWQNELFQVHLRSGEVLESEALLVATGRQANTRALQPERSGIALDERGNVKVDTYFRTTCPGVYAIGDVTGQPGFTHVSWEDHRRLIAILDGNHPPRSQMDRVLGYAMFTDPQVGRAGLTLSQAQAQGFNAHQVELPLHQVARASEIKRMQGFYQLVIDQNNDRIIGATLISPQAAELIHIFIALMECAATWQTLEEAVFIHPTFAEGLPSLARQLK